MMPLGLHFLAALGTALTSLLSLLLLLAVSRQLWTLGWNVSRDRGNKLPLPKGSMGWPLLGETLHWMVEGSKFHTSRREKYGNVFKTHLLGRPVIRVSGAENIRRILLGEHRLVSAQWPHSTRLLLGLNTLGNSSGELHRQRRKILARVFSHAALDSYLPGIQQLVRSRVRAWCRGPSPVAVYPAAKALTFCIAVRILLGLRAADQQLDRLTATFEQLVENIFSLPVDMPFSGLRKGIKARNALHEYLETAIREKLQANRLAPQPDALTLMLHSARENGKELNLQELKEAAVELIFAAFSTTASACTSLVLLLLQHSEALDKVRQELDQHGLLAQCQCPPDWPLSLHTPSTPDNSAQHRMGSQANRPGAEGCPPPITRENVTRDSSSMGDNMSHASVMPEGICSQSLMEPGAWHFPEAVPSQGTVPEREAPDCECQPLLRLDTLSRLRYLDCVVKEVLRLLPPVSGGYRTALQTFELNGCQIPKGWNIIYSIRDTQETAAVYLNPDTFDPDRFGPERDESKAGRFNYLPFGGGVRSCVGKELAQVILKTLAVELSSAASWQLASATYPKMQTVPVVHPVDGLKVRFHRGMARERKRPSGNDK
ncbi:cytochrome P450 26C1-like isoform X1 [Stegostoma tigrinum]|uniref:cytochrome P450 26C1-like isoform X1 n=1 Tax=Stegostoma tigrinum TaxID=3053191 RepID=UPI00202B8E6F|nr:cytochrome P450 26C1-like isoform X1 [Stegostoma tigrinum]